MLNFQQQAEKDLDAVFFNAAAMEFVTTHSIAGIRGMKASPAVELGVVVDYELYNERKIKDKIEGISLNGLVFFIKKAEWLKHFGSVPKVNAALQFDNEKYQIAAVNDDFGVLEITLEANRG